MEKSVWNLVYNFQLGKETLFSFYLSILLFFPTLGIYIVL